MVVGAGDDTGTATRETLLRSRGYSDAVIAGNGNGNGRPEVETPATAVEKLPAEALHPVCPAPSCALVDCVEPVPAGRRSYCSAEHADEAERRRSCARQRPGKKRTTRRVQLSRPSAPVAKEEPPPAGDQVDEAPGRPSVVHVVTELLASGVVVGVELSLDGTVVVARGHR